MNNPAIYRVEMGRFFKFRGSKRNGIAANPDSPEWNWNGGAHSATWVLTHLSCHIAALCALIIYLIILLLLLASTIHFLWSYNSSLLSKSHVGQKLHEI